MTISKRTIRSTTKADLQIGQRIKELRSEAGMSQEELGRHLGVSFQQVQKYEKGSNRVGSSRLVKIAEALGRPVTDFYGLPARQRKVETLFGDDAIPTALPLLRAYARIKDQTVARTIVVLVERIAANER
jgi:transcriptional regulator with XRE-family HTH domain